MTPDEVFALLQIIARQQLQIARLEAAVAQAQEAAKAPAEPRSTDSQSLREGASND